MTLCRACGLDFYSVELFERHRVGVHVWRPSDWDEIATVLR